MSITIAGLCGRSVNQTISRPKGTEGINYSVEGEVEAGATIKVIATPEDGFKLIEAEGWKLNEDGTATFTVTFDKVTQCPTTEEPTENPKETPAPDTKDPETKAPEAKDKDSLADTGLASLPFVAVGLGLVAAGALIVAKRRKKA